jgi:uncharacterized membrane protein YcaP (DUF421 family)
MLTALLPMGKIIFSSVTVYFFIIIAIRLFGKKELAQLSVFDLVFILLISNAVQNAMVGADSTLTGGLVAAGSLFAANAVLKYLLYRFPVLGGWIQGEPVLLIYHGRINQEHMKKTEITLAELKEAVREHGVADISAVDLAILEMDGNISILSDGFRHQTVKKRKLPKILRKSSG